jgi:Lysozyme like domain
VPVYTYAQLEGLWISAGGSADTAPIAAAIAEAESGGNPQAVNATDNNGTQTSWGLWQISNGTHNQPVPNILDPVVNAQQAVAKYQASGWQPWGTYTSGAYKAYLSSSTTPQLTGLPVTSSASTSATASYATTCLVGFPGISLPLFGDVGSFCVLSRSEVRGLLGGMLIGVAGVIGLAAAVILAASAFEHSGAANAVNQAVGKVAPAGAVVKAVTPAGRRERALSGRERAVGQRERVTRLERRERRNPAR